MFEQSISSYIFAYLEMEEYHAVDNRCPQAADSI